MDRHVLHAVEVDEGGRNDQHVEDLVGLEPDVTFTRQEPLWYPGPVQHRTEDVETTHDEHPVDGGLHQGSVPARHDQEVGGWDKSKATQTDEQESPDWPVGGAGEAVHHGDDDSTDTKNGYNREIDNLGYKLAVEPVVDPWDKTTNSKEADPDIVKLAEQFGNVFRMTAHSVEEAGEAQAQDGTNEEEKEDELLSERQVSVTLVTERLHIEDNCHSDESNKSYEMGPNISSF